MTLRKPVILVVDDEPMIQKVLSLRLSSVGYEVVTAGDGEEALAKIEKIKPDLIILDISMPNMSGITFYGRILTDDDKPKFPILVLTARASLEEMFRDLEIDGFVTKPFKVEDLLNEIKLILEKRYGPEAPAVPDPASRQKKVLIVENEEKAFEKIVVTFARAGFAVSGAKTALEAMELARSEAPDVVLIKLGLPDFPGDALAAKFKQMPKTMGMPLVLYSHGGHELDVVVANKICKKIGIPYLVESDDPAVLLKYARGL